ncbi:hypothetical protein [Dysgonomonas sp. 25]|uniref:hypothetical protein n=1 Tax=Dysgonomonas sp. 25 TaxID=2302933 RepID=UPI0013D888F4|nr:hypothetical protein [Dysgonomonas sp. 25]NDV67931.1 hypothetical protein [Dysgonomonas sp. 25]
MKKLKKLKKLKLREYEILSNTEMKMLRGGYENNNGKCYAISPWGRDQCTGTCSGEVQYVYQYIDQNYGTPQQYTATRVRTCKPRTYINEGTTLICECK